MANSLRIRLPISPITVITPGAPRANEGFETPLPVTTPTTPPALVRQVSFSSPEHPALVRQISFSSPELDFDLYSPPSSPDKMDVPRLRRTANTREQDDAVENILADHCIDIIGDRWIGIKADIAKSRLFFTRDEWRGGDAIIIMWFPGGMTHDAGWRELTCNILQKDNSVQITRVKSDYPLLGYEPLE